MNLRKQFNNKKSDAFKKGIEFKLSYEQYKKIWMGETCFYTDKELTQENKSIDRVDSTKGYTVENSVLCDKDLNVSKGNLSKEQIDALYKKLNSLPSSIPGPGKDNTEVQK